FYLIEGTKVKRILRCRTAPRVKPELIPYQTCWLTSSYRDGILLRATFNRQRYEHDWLDIADRLDALLHSFEQPAAAMPPSALAGKN
ncbi:MAG: hypothetical protein LBQ75_08885, partial [Zoogloeaceae bacterium]|nr:hypothetical protein [Zoogloeaceae bacterium]